MGVGYELFWTLNPKSLSPFIKAFSLKQKYDDSMAWQSGMYIRMAVASCFDKNTKYPNAPILKDATIVAETDAEKIKRKFMERAEILNMRFEKGGE